jgi:hypothetical protein
MIKSNTTWSTWDSEETRSNKFYPIEILHDQEKYVVAEVADEADANLIAAAPDLLHVAEMVIRDTSSADVLLLFAKAAVAKARGQV